MNKILFLILLFVLCGVHPGKKIFAQNNPQDTSYEDNNSGDIISIYDDDKKYKFLGFIKLGANFGESLDPGFDLQISAYNMFDRTVGLGAEFQYNHLAGSDLYIFNIFNGYSYTMEGRSSDLFLLKVNLLIGNMHPENKTVFYGLLGGGFQYRTDFETVLDFSYGGGAGFFYKFEKEIGFNAEFQYNTVSSYGLNGIVTLNMGIVYTVF